MKIMIAIWYHYSDRMLFQLSPDNTISLNYILNNNFGRKNQFRKHYLRLSPLQISNKNQLTVNPYQNSHLTLKIIDKRDSRRKIAWEIILVRRPRIFSITLSLSSKKILTPSGSNS